MENGCVCKWGLGTTKHTCNLEILSYQEWALLLAGLCWLESPASMQFGAVWSVEDNLFYSLIYTCDEDMSPHILELKHDCDS